MPYREEKQAGLLSISRDSLGNENFVRPAGKGTGREFLNFLREFTVKNGIKGIFVP